MSIVEELEYYCDRKTPTGTIMLTGEWGTGKTYFIENVFGKKNKDKLVIVRVSLFGIDSIASMHKAIKEAWINAYIKEMGKDELYSKCNTVMHILRKINISDTFQKMLDIDILDVIFVKREIGEKKVVLVFDDLERSEINILEILGCINDYCENKQFHTIIVSNENKMDNFSAENNLRYLDIKEKIVQKTIMYLPDHKEIVSSVLNVLQINSADYKNYLSQKIQILANIFEKYGNVRSLKCALQEFERIYTILNEKNIPNKSEYLMTFVCYVMYSKSNSSSFEWEEMIQQLKRKNGSYFKPQCLLESQRVYVDYGQWNEKQFRKELDNILQIQKNYAKKILKKEHLLNLDESKLEEDFDVLLQEVYDGKISIEEYLLFIVNLSRMRQYNYTLYDSVNLNLVQQGIEICKRNLIEEKRYDIEILYDFDMSQFNNREKSIYYDVVQFLRVELVFQKGKNMYLDTISKNTFDAWNNCKNIKCISFDKEMAESTINYLLNASNDRKNLFVSEFIDYWKGCMDNPDFNYDEFKKCIIYIIDLLRKEQKNYYESGKRITSAILGYSIDNMKELIN